MKNQRLNALLLALSITTPFTFAFTFSNRFRNVESFSTKQRTLVFSSSTENTEIVSPFAGNEEKPAESFDGPLDLTEENVEIVLDSLRHFLQADGGDVSLTEIDGPVVKLQLEGACGTCPSSTMTMKMGLERGLKEKIPEIQEVIQVMPEGPGLSEEEVEVILGGVRPFLQVAGGSIKLVRLEGIDGLQPTITLKMEGASATLNSVKLEIVQRLQRHFMMSGLRVEWDQ